MQIFIILLLLVLSACDDGQEQESPASNDQQQEQILEKKAELKLTKVSFKSLPDWQNDNFKSFAPAFGRSCGAIMKKDPKLDFGVLKPAGTYGDWQKICKNFAGIDIDNSAELRLFFEQNLTPYQISEGDEVTGLFTGYYEASLHGSYKKQAPYIYPIHKRPKDLVMVLLGDFRDDLKGVRIAGRVKNGRLRPYEQRADIVNGNWPHNDEVLIWVDDPVDAFFVQIQGSGLVQMNDGSVLRIGYDGQNGHPYYAIGRELIKIGAIEKENISMQSIRAWLEQNPKQADEIMNSNKSYVFFRKITGEGPIGAQGVALSAERSLAVDRTLISYGLPLWVDINGVTKESEPIRRLMISQDTGGAITGAVRGDVFWGYGKEAEEMAGKMNSKGRYWVLLPKANSH